MVKVNIRPFESRDAAGVTTLILAIQRGEFEIAITSADQPDLSDIPGFYQTGAGNFWVAVMLDDVVGTLGLRDLGSDNVALRKMFVASEYRGKPHRVAQHLLSAALDWAAERRCRNIFLGTTSRFLAAHRFYEGRARSPSAPYLGAGVLMSRPATRQLLPLQPARLPLEEPA